MKYDIFDTANFYITCSLSRPNSLRYAIFAAESCLYMFEAAFPDDKRPRKAIESAKRVLADDSKKNRDIADDDVRTATNIVDHNSIVSDAVAYSAYSARNAARIAASCDSYYAARNAARYAVYSDPSLALSILCYGVKLLQQDKISIDNPILKQIAVDMAVDDMLTAAFTESIDFCKI